MHVLGQHVPGGELDLVRDSDAATPDYVDRRTADLNGQAALGAAAPVVSGAFTFDSRAVDGSLAPVLECGPERSASLGAVACTARVP